MSEVDKKITRIVRLFLIVGLIVGLVGIVISEIVLPNETDSVDYFCERFETQWVQVMDDGSSVPIEVPGTLDGEYGAKFTIRTTIPTRLVQAGYLAVKSSRQDVNIYVEDDLRATYSTKDTRLYGKSSAPYYVFAKFNTSDEGKTLTIEYQTQSAYSGIISYMYYGSQTGIWMKLAFNEGMELFMGVIMSLLALICILVGFILRVFYHRHLRGGDILYLGIGVLLAGIWVVCQSPFRQMVFPNISAVSDMTFFALMLMPIPFLIYIDEAQGYIFTKLYEILAMIAMANTVVCSVLQLTNIVDFQYSVMAMFVVLGLTILSFVFTIAVDIRKKRIGSYMLIAIGLGGVCIAGIVQMLTYLKRDLQFGGVPMCIGFIFMLIMAVVRLMRSAVDTEQEKQEAIHASKMQEQFLANMSHEIRTPLNAIIGLNDMVLKESSESHIREYSTDIKGASKTLLGLINDILDFSRIESGKVDLTPVKYWTAFLLTDSYNLIAKRAEEKHIELKVEADPMTPEQLYGDETRIRQIITNLLTNAVKYTDEGTITLKLHWRKNSIETALIRISVQDTGQGITEENQEKLFQSFQRVDEKRNRNIEGTGLGLVISKQLVELMGGRIWVKSVYGEGSEFFVEFPQMIVSEKGMGEFSPRVTISNEMMTTHSVVFTAPDAKILVVDDVETNLKVMRNLIKDTYIRVETASSGFECLDLTETNAYDMIFLDHRMPEMDGIETLHKMRARQDDINQETPVIMLTANVVAGAKENYISEGFTDYLTKPIRQSDLKQMLIDYLPIHKVMKEEVPFAE